MRLDLKLSSNICHRFSKFLLQISNYQILFIFNIKQNEKLYRHIPRDKQKRLQQQQQQTSQNLEGKNLKFVPDLCRKKDYEVGVNVYGGFWIMGSLIVIA